MRLLGFLGFFLAASFGVLAQTNAAPEVRKLSLEDCIQIALEHNLDVKIRRLNPELSEFALRASYGAYDPTLNVSGEHAYNQSAGGLDQYGRPFGGTETTTESFSTTLNGLLPWGTAYSLGGRFSDAYGSSPGVVTGSPFVVTNGFLDINTGNQINFLTTNHTQIAARVPFENASANIGLFSLRQPLLRGFLIDNTRLQILLERKNVQISELDLKNQIMNTVTAVEQAYFDLIFSQENVRVQQKALELAERLLAENRKRVEVGAMAPLDEKQAESQAAASRADLLAAQGSADTQQRVLKNLLSDDYSQWKDVALVPGEAMLAMPADFDLQESWRKGLSYRPDLLQQFVALEKQGFIIRFQKNQLLPQFDVIGSAGLSASSRTDMYDAFGQIAGRDNPFWSVGGQMSIPLGNRTARYNYKSAKLTRDQISLQLKQLQQLIMIQIENAIANAKTAFQRVSATREARVYAEAALEAEQKKLESGKSTSFEVLRLQRDLTSARSSEIRALADYNVALAQVALNEGSTLDRRKVSIEVK